MERAAQARAVSRPSVDEGLPLRLSDVVITSLGTLAASLLLIVARWVPGCLPAALTFVVIALGPPVFRALARRFPRFRIFDVIASFWLLPCIIAAHASLGPLIDAMNPGLMDGRLAAADLRLFGEHPSVTLGRHLSGVATDALMVCYYTYFLWPFMLGIFLYARGSRRVFDEYILALALCFGANFALYALVPAIGPRFFLAHEFDGPLRGWILTPFLDSVMRTPVFMKDCFPSGHTGITLLVLVYAYNHFKRFFWVMLPVGTGIVLATLVGRFHYGIDLICAVPLMIAAVSSASLLAKVRPEGVVVPQRVFEWRDAIRVP
jgi:hypothetical protein